MTDSATHPASTPVIELHSFHALRPGPRVLVLGGVHGNETAGPVAIRQILAEFADGRRQLQRGTLSFVPVANPVAWAAGRREGDRNLNRDFRPSLSPENAEDRIASRLGPILASHDVLVDLHTFSAPGVPFVFFGPVNNQDELEPFAHAADEERLAQAIGPQRLVYGWLSAYAKGVRRRQNGSIAYGIGTTEYMRAHGGYAVTVECGQHLDPEAPAVARAAIDNTLRLLGLGGLADEDEKDVRTAHAAETGTPAGEGTSHGRSDCHDGRISQGNGCDAGTSNGNGTRNDNDTGTGSPTCSGKELIELYDVFDRHDLQDRFAREWRSFDRVAAGEPIAFRADGQAIRAPEDGYVVFPNPGTPPGREWFYFARPGQRQLSRGNSH